VCDWLQWLPGDAWDAGLLALFTALAVATRFYSLHLPDSVA
jgi:hypothetical protein